MHELELQARVINELQLGTSIPDIAAKLNIATVKVTRIKNKYDDAVKNNTVNELLKLDQVLLNTASEQLRSELTSFDEAIDGLKGKVKDSSELLANLDADLVNTAHIANNKLRVFIAGAESAGELGMLIDSLAVLRNSFFNKNVTNVAIQNNMGASIPAFDFSSDAPGELYENK